MLEDTKTINNFLVNTFHDILKIEERVLINCSEGDLSIKEFHLLETVMKENSNKGNNTAGNIAREMRVTPGTLTTAVKSMEKKGYLIRKRDTSDKRSIHILPSKKGEKATEKHALFHEEMVTAITSALNEEETLIFTKGLRSLVDFFQGKDNKEEL